MKTLISIFLILIPFACFAQSYKKKERLIAKSKRELYQSFQFITDTSEYKYPTIYAWADPINKPIQLIEPWSVGYNEELKYEHFGQLGWLPQTKEILTKDSSALSAQHLKIDNNLNSNSVDTTINLVRHFSAFNQPAFSYYTYPNLYGRDTLSKELNEYNSNGELVLKREFSLNNDSSRLELNNEYRYQNSRKTQRLSPFISANFISQLWYWTYNEERNGVLEESVIYMSDSSENWLVAKYEEFDSLGKSILEATLEKNLATMKYDTISKSERRFERNYDNRGNSIEETTLNKINDSTWLPYYRLLTSYNELNLPIEYTIQRYNLTNNYFMSTYKFLYTYNSSGLLKETISYNNRNWDTVLNIDSKGKYSYTDFGNIAMHEIEKYDTLSSSFKFFQSNHYYYETYFADEVFVDTKDILSTTFPNPFTSNVKFVINSENDEKCQISIFDINGQIIELLYFKLTSGINNIEWSGCSAPNGFYFAKIDIGKKSKTIKLIKQ